VRHNSIKSYFIANLLLCASEKISANQSTFMQLWQKDGDI